MATISLKQVVGVSPREGGNEGRQGFSLEVEDRELVVLAGPPKSGVTGIVRMIAGLDPIVGGEILIGERRVNDMEPVERDVALVSKGYVPYPRRSVSGNVAFGLEKRKRPKAEIKKRVTAASELVGIQGLLDHEPKSLSIEQRQRVALARAIALQPKVFLFDDPLSNLAASSRDQLRAEIIKLHERLQTTMIYGTHDPAEALAMGGRVVILNKGVLEQAGTALSLYEEPANRFVAEFLGAINLVNGTMKRDRDSWVFQEREDGSIRLRWPTSGDQNVRELAEGPVTLGIRPEDIEITEQADNRDKQSDVFPAIVDLVEPMDGATRLSLQTGGHIVTCRVKSGTINQGGGRRLYFRLDPKKLRLFDPESGRRISEQS